MTALSFLWNRTLEVSCTIDVEQTFDSLHAYVDLDGVEVAPGDRVLVHGAPTDIAYGERRICRGTATITRASALGRMAARIEGYLELTDLYEVGFSEGRTA
jgi:hypothetical protein